MRPSATQLSAVTGAARQATLSQEPRRTERCTPRVPHTWSDSLVQMNAEAPAPACTLQPMCHRLSVASPACNAYMYIYMNLATRLCVIRWKRRLFSHPTPCIMLPASHIPHLTPYSPIPTCTLAQPPTCPTPSPIDDPLPLLVCLALPHLTSLRLT